MTTIPIEVIIQDAESPVTPTPTPESGGETNITVPDTGTISDGGSNGGGIESSASIILPAIIAVLAIGAIVAMLVHKHNKHQNDKLSKKEKLATVASSTIAILAATVLVGNLVMPATSAATSVEPGTAELDTVDKITITATREIDSDITIATVKNTSYATANLDFGYKVTASMAENATTANLYLDGDETSEYYIAPVENKNKENENIEDENTAGNAELANNTWGYTLEEPSEGTSTTYLPIPLEDTPATITKGNDMVEDEAVDIYYTIKVDKDLPAGSYMGELEYNISPAVEYMQDFATMTEAEKTATLANMPEGQQYTLKDIRDEKSYYISKLADGNVWMTQNLDLDLSTEITFTSKDTDVSADWTPSSSTKSFTGTTVDGWGSSANPGDIYYYTSSNDEPDTIYNSLTDCERDHNDGSCPHYHAGNYYRWYAAIARNSTPTITEQFQNASNSICPAGWRLPVNANADSYTVGNEQFTLLALSGNILGDWFMNGSQSGAYKYQESGVRLIRENPVWLVRSGFVGGGTLHSGAEVAKYWSSTASTVGGEGALDLTFNDYSIRHVGIDSYADGESVRCLAR